MALSDLARSVDRPGPAKNAARIDNNGHEQFGPSNLPKCGAAGFGSAEEECGKDETVLRALPEYVAGHPPFELRDIDISAFSCGTIGWVTGLATVHVFAGAIPPFRFTQVFHMVDGFLRLIQQHTSIPTINFEEIVQELSQLQDRLDAAPSSTAEPARTGLANTIIADRSDSTTIANAIGGRRRSDTIKSHVARVEQIMARRHDDQVAG